MTFDEAMEKVQALWPNANLKEQPIGAHGIVKILQEFGLLTSRDFDSERKMLVERTKAAQDELKQAQEDKLKEFNKLSPNKGFEDESGS